MADDPTDHAIDVIARAIAAEILAEFLAISTGARGYGISDPDAVRIDKRIQYERTRLAPGRDQIDAAYEHLANREEGQ